MTLLSWAERLCAASAPSDLIDLHVRDALAAVFVGLNTGDGRALARLYSVRGNRVDVAASVAAIARLSECDDIHLPSCVTPGAVVIPVALALTSDRHGDAFNRAVSAGYAAGLSLGAALGGAKALGHGVWPTLLAAPLMAAVTASCVYKHEPAQLAHAIALALSGASGRIGRPSGTPPGRWFAFSEAVAKGIHAAEAAGQGFRGDLGLISDHWLTAQAGHHEIDLAALDSPPAMSDTGFKPFPIARQGLNAVVAFQRVLENTIEPGEIESIAVFVPPMNVALLTRPIAKDDRLSRLCNMGFQLACAALAPDLLYDPERVATQPLIDFAQRVAVAPAHDLETHLPHHWAARVVVKTPQQTWEETIIRTDFDAGANGLQASLRPKWSRMCTDAPGLASADPFQLWQQIEQRVTMAANRSAELMKIIDSHFHWWPRSVFETLCKRTSYPLCEKNGRGGYNYVGEPGRPSLNSWTEWFDLDKQLEHMDGLGHEVGVVCSLGPFSIYFSDLPAEEGRDAAIQWNEEMAGAQRRYPGRVWASAAIPMTDTKTAIDVLNDAVGRLGLMGVNIPGSIGRDPKIDAERLEPLYARIAELGIPAFLHPTDAVFGEALEGYGGALHLSLGRVIEVSVAASRLMFSGLMERHPNLKIVMSHTGGALPYQSGRMDKNGKGAKLPKPPSTYIRRMFTDTVSPHSAGMKFAIEYYGIDNVMYGSDYPCWDPATALALIDEIGLSAADKEKLFNRNVRRIMGLKDSTKSAVPKPIPAAAE